MKILAKNDSYIDRLVLDTNYDIMSNGTMRTLITQSGKLSVTNTWRNILIHKNNSGYFYVNYDYKKLALHRIMYRKFIGELNPSLVINHKDGNPSNNLVENLELITQAQNNEHRYKVLGHKAVKGNKTIDFRIASAIRILHKKHGLSGNELSKIFGMSKSWISQVLTDKIWTNP
jgi:HNH endonuclease